MASSSDDNLDDSRKDDATPYDKTNARKVSESPTVSVIGGFTGGEQGAMPPRTWPPNKFQESLSGASRM